MTVYGGGLVEAVIKVAWGADPDGDPTGWTFTDITAYLRELEGITITKGSTGQSDRAAPSELRFSLRNADGRFTPGYVEGANYPNVRRGLPVRVEVPYGASPPTERITAFVDSWAPRWDRSLNLAVVDVIAYGRMRRLAQRAPLRSAMFRTMSGTGFYSGRIVPLAYWSAEDASGASRIASAISPAYDATLTGAVSLAADASLAGSAALPTLGDGGRITFPVPAYVDTGQWSVLVAVRVPTNLAATTTLVEVRTTGTAPVWQLRVVAGTPDKLNVLVLDHLGSTLLDSSVDVSETTFYGAWHLLALGADQDGADVDWSVSCIGADGVLTNSGTLAARTTVNVRTATVTGTAATDGMGVGHLAVITDPAFDLSLGPLGRAAALDGHAGERPHERVTRLATEEGIPFTIIQDVTFDEAATTVTTALGPQPSLTALDALAEAVDADHGLLHDGGPGGVLTAVMRSSRYNTFATLAVDIDSGEVAELAPVLDERSLRNDVTVSRDGGASARYVDAASVAAEGRFAERVTISAFTDDHLVHHAGWLVALGTVPGMRYPALALNLRRAHWLADDWSLCRIGSLVIVFHPPPQHAPDAINLFIDGYTERITRAGWDVVAACSPTDPFEVRTVEGATIGRLDSDGSELAASFAAGTATSMSVAVTAGPLWLTTATHPAQFPFAVVCGGVELTVTAITGAASPQTFTVSTTTVNGVVKTIPAGTAVHVALPLKVAL